MFDLPRLVLERVGLRSHAVERCVRCGHHILFGDKDSASQVLLSKGALRVSENEIRGRCQACGSDFVLPREKLLAQEQHSGVQEHQQCGAEDPKQHCEPAVV